MYVNIGYNTILEPSTKRVLNAGQVRAHHIAETPLATQNSLFIYLQNKKQTQPTFLLFQTKVDQIPIALANSIFSIFFLAKSTAKTYRRSSHPHTFLCSPAVIGLSRSTMPQKVVNANHNCREAFFFSPNILGFLLYIPWLYNANLGYFFAKTT